MKLTEMVGKRYSKLVVIEAIGNRKVFAKCDCGNSVTTLGYSVSSGATKSCGCIRKENTSKMFFKHGHTVGQAATREYIAWQNMWKRCTDHKSAQYWRYGGRGISVCKEWKSFERFLADMGPCPHTNWTLDRIDNDSGYSVENCRWASYTTQARNRRNSLFVTYRGVKIPLVAFADYMETNYSTMRDKLDSIIKEVNAA